MGVATSNSSSTKSEHYLTMRQNNCQIYAAKKGFLFALILMIVLFPLHTFGAMGGNQSLFICCPVRLHLDSRGWADMQGFVVYPWRQGAATVACGTEMHTNISLIDLWLMKLIVRFQPYIFNFQTCCVRTASHFLFARIGLDLHLYCPAGGKLQGVLVCPWGEWASAGALKMKPISKVCWKEVNYKCLLS